MDCPGNYKDLYNALLAEMARLKEVRDDSTSKGRRMDRWMKDVEEKEIEVDKLQKKFNELPGGIFPTHISARDRFSKEVWESLKAAKALKERADEISESIEMFISEVATRKPLQFSHGQIIRYTSNLETPIGSGGFGKVYKGKLPDGVEVAVKVLNGAIVMDDMEKQFKAEVSTMGKAYHRNLAQLYGFCFEPKMKALVYEYMENGSLDNLLFNQKRSIKWEKLYGIAIGTARGLSYLHEHCPDRVIHLDIKAGNVLLDSNFSPKLTDFGLARLCSRDKSRVITQFRGTRIYDAPEACMEMPTITYRCDTFSFGMMLFEVLSRRLNSDGENSFRRQLWENFARGKVEKVVKECGINGEKDEKRAKTLAIVALWCAQDSSKLRPSMSTVVKVLEGEIRLPAPPNPFFPSTASSSEYPSFLLASCNSDVTVCYSMSLQTSKHKNLISTANNSFMVLLI